MKEKVKIFAKTVLAILVPIFTFYLFEWFTHNPKRDMLPGIQVYNIILLELIMVLLFMLTGSLRIALFIEMGFFIFYGLANYFVFSFRSLPIQPWDLYSIRTAVSVAGNYDYDLTYEVKRSLLGFFVLIIVVWFCGKWKLKKNYLPRIIGGVCSVILLAVYVNLLRSEDFTLNKLHMYDKLFTLDTMSYKNGTAVAFLYEMQYMNVEVPKGYDTGEQEKILASKNADSSEGRQPNIIVIMDEAFFDPAILGEFETNKDYMPFIHSLQSNSPNTVTGNLHVSVKGGNTPNTEFEFLTGNTMAFLPHGSIAYQQFIHSETPSIVSYLRSMGYATRAAHPYNANGWYRNKVYPLLGFEQSDFKESFADEKIRNYISDAAAFSFIKEAYEEKDDKPMFFFEVTMQNHSGYTDKFDNFTPDVYMINGGTDELSMYLSLVRQTDMALKDLIDYFEGQNEEVVIVFFGDHQTKDSVVEPILEGNGKTVSSLNEEEQKDRYVVPFIIWANFDIEEEHNIEISANYLSDLVFEKAGIQLSPYQQYLEDIRMTIPVISAEEVRYSDEKEGDNALVAYQKMQYYQLFKHN